MVIKKILITGASGKVRTHLLKQLLSLDYQVKVITRSPRKFTSRKNLEIIRDDLSNPKKLTNAMKNIDVLIHLAAVLGNNLTKDEAEKVNFEATKKILQDADKQGVKQIIYFSTLSVLANNGKKITGGGELKKDFSDEYGRTKALAVSWIRNNFSDEVITLFPPAILNHNDISPTKSKIWFTLFGGNFSGWFLGRIGDKNRHIAYVTVDDLTEIIIKIIQKNIKNGEYLTVSECLTTQDYLKKMIKSRKGVYLPFRIPLWSIKILNTFTFKRVAVLSWILSLDFKDLKCDQQKIYQLLKIKPKTIEDLVENFTDK